MERLIIILKYYVGYVDKNKPKDWRVNSVNPLHLIINKVFCSIGEENGIKYLKIEKNRSEPAFNKWSFFILLKIILKKLAMKKSILMMILTKLNLLVMIL